MTNYEQIIQITEVITNLEKDIVTATEAKQTASSKDLPEAEQNLQYLESLLQDFQTQKEKLITEL
ncbi:hypothetical protein N9795_00590 [Candidatus Pelagibacter sp.]|nr:hypothetical protein [Candidatus Pelagibacter sp.]